MNRPRLLNVTGLLAALLVAAVITHAQVTTATIYGNVADAKGASVAGATVTATNSATAATASTTTDGEGEFTFTYLPVGRYTIAIRANGFKGQMQANVDLSAGQRLRLTYALEVGQVSEQITITTEPPLINTVSSEQRETFETIQVRELPTFRRDWSNLLRVNTGIGGATANLAGGLSVNGLPGGGISVTVDGTEASQNPEHSSLGMFGNFNTIRVLSLEAIGEINVTKGIAPAEIANTLSSNINIISKGGTNDFHGSAFENYQSGGLNARNQFLTRAPGAFVPIPKVIFHQFGGSVGGPIIKNKLFFFGVYEGVRQNDFLTLSANVPTQEFRARALAAVPGYKPWFDLINLPTEPVRPGDIIGLFNGTGARTAADNHMVARGDYYITQNNLLTARYTRGRPTRSSPNSNSPQNPQDFTGKTDFFTASLTHSRSRFTTEARFGFGSSDVVRLDNIYALEVPGLSLQNPSFGMAGEILATKGKNWSYEQIVSATRGRHTFKFGGLYQYLNQTRSNIETPAISYCTVDDFLANIPCNSQITFGLNPFLIRLWSLGFFAQDDFKVNSRLVLNLGMRYDYFSVPSERDDRLFNRDEPFGFGPLRDPDSIYEADRNNFSPRVGFAWTVDSEAKTVVRGGFGMFHMRQPIIATVELVRNALDEPFRVVFNRAEGIQRNIKYPVTNAQVLPLVKSPNFDWTGTTTNPNFPAPYSLQWNLGVQRQLTGTLAVETAYVGTRGVKLLFNRDMNQVDRVTGQRPVAGFGRFRHFDTSDSSYYHAWQTSVRKRFTQDFSFDVHYTYAQNISYQLGDLYSLSGPQDNNNIRLEKGPSPNDIRHRFVSDFIYELPFARYFNADTRAKKLLLGGWQFTGIYQAESGAPFHIAQGGALTNQRIDLLADPYLDGAGDRLNYLSRAAVARAPFNNTPGGQVQARPGTMGRNALRGPGFWNIDLALSKNLAFTERYRLQLRVDMFNAFNHTAFSGINTNLDSSTFGRFTSTRGARTVQLNARFTF